MSIGESSLSSYELDDLDLFLMEKERIADHIIDDRRNREGKKCKKCKYTILKNMECNYNRCDTLELALVVEKLLPENILIIVEQISILQNDSIEVHILIQSYSLDLKCIWKRILSRSFDDADEIWIENLVASIGLIASNRSDHDAREGRPEFIDEHSRLEALDRITTLIVDRELDT